MGDVYVLCDPGDGTPMYVGATLNSPEERLQQHIDKPVNANMRIWMKELEEESLSPEIRIFKKNVASQRLGQAEQRARDILSEEFDLLNATNHKHLGESAKKDKGRRLDIQKSVLLTETQEEGIENIADRFGIPQGRVIRFALDQVLLRLEKKDNGGS